MKTSLDAMVFSLKIFVLFRFLLRVFVKKIFTVFVEGFCWEIIFIDFILVWFLICSYILSFNFLPCLEQVKKFSVAVVKATLVFISGPNLKTRTSAWLWPKLNNIMIINLGTFPEQILSIFYITWPIRASRSIEYSI